jgi:hypothetical protein
MSPAVTTIVSSSALLTSERAHTMYRRSSTASVSAAAFAIRRALILAPSTDLPHLASPAATGILVNSGCATITASISS